MISQQSLNNLIALCERHRDAGVAFKEAVEANAIAHQLDRAALARYVRAAMRDKVDSLIREHQTLMQLGLDI